MDERARALERAEGDDDAARLLRERLRAGTLSEARLEVAAALGHPPAAAALGTPPGPAAPATLLVTLGALGWRGLLSLAEALLCLHPEPLIDEAAQAGATIRARLRGEATGDLTELFVAAMVPTLQGRGSTEVLSVLMAAAILDAERAGGPQREALEGYLAAREESGDPPQGAIESAAGMLLPVVESAWPDLAPPLRDHLLPWLLSSQP